MYKDAQAVGTEPTNVLLSPTNTFRHHQQQDSCFDDLISNNYDLYSEWTTFNEFTIHDRSCCVSGINYGLRNRLTNEVKAYPCHRMNCPRHWLNYAHLTIPKLTSKLPDKAHWRAFRFTCPVRLKTGTRQPAIKAWVDKALKAYQGCHITTFLHRGKHDHYHVLVGHDQELDPEQGRDLWKAHRPGKRKFPEWSTSWWASTLWTHPANFIRYCFKGKKAKPRKVPPWKGLPVKYPYRQYGELKA